MSPTNSERQRKVAARRSARQTTLHGRGGVAAPARHLAALVALRPHAELAAAKKNRLQAWSKRTAALAPRYASPWSNVILLPRVRGCVDAPMTATASAFLFADRRERSTSCSNRPVCCIWCAANAARSISAPTLADEDLDARKPRGRPTASGNSCQVKDELPVRSALLSPRLRQRGPQPLQPRMVAAEDGVA